ncbi:MAG: M23 family metallopeptidase, partial [Longimicrobiales bacterium]
TVQVTVPNATAFVFPVAGGSASAIAGRWGDARDGGSRDHKGVDIFAPRGTPVVAVTDGYVMTVETTSSGGRVIWQRDEANGLMYFYAHLDEQMMTAGQRVERGDTIGRVGNSGNAQGSSTHLHFGIFRPGYIAEDPTIYLQQSVADAQVPASGAWKSIDVDQLAMLGRRVRLPSDRVRLRASPDESAPIIQQMGLGTELVLIGYLNGWNRVLLNDGTTGFVAARLLKQESRAGQR